MSGLRAYFSSERAFPLYAALAAMALAAWTFGISWSTSWSLWRFLPLVGASSYLAASYFRSETRYIRFAAGLLGFAAPVWGLPTVVGLARVAVAIRGGADTKTTLDLIAAVQVPEWPAPFGLGVLALCGFALNLDYKTRKPSDLQREDIRKTLGDAVSRRELQKVLRGLAGREPLNPDAVRIIEEFLARGGHSRLADLDAWLKTGDEPPEKGAE